VRRAALNDWDKIARSLKRAISFISIQLSAVSFQLFVFADS
jgi:hypothetical protein